MDQRNILENMIQFNKKDQKKIRRKRDTYESAYAFYEGQELTLNAFKSGIFPIKKKGKGLKYELLDKCFKDNQ